MKIKINGIVLCLFGIGVGVIFGNWKSQAQDTDNNLHPKVVRSQDNGWVYYQRIILNNASFQFLENKKTLSCYSNFVDYDVSEDEENHLSNFRLHLQSSSERAFRSEPGRGSLIPLSNSTLYQDLNGDSVLDTMIKHGPQGHGSYILYKDAWVQVNNSKMGFAIGRAVFANQTKTTYIFNKNAWEKKD
jgi:hypothetical protein